MDLFFATAPVVLLVYLMGKPSSMPSQRALPLVALVMYFVRLIYFADEPNLIHATVVQGLLSAIVPISIIAGAIFLFRVMEATGAMGRIRIWLNTISENQVAQLMIVGWAFSFLIEGASGFGTPAALAGPILVGLGHPAFRVAIFCLVMNSVPVSFGAVGTPTWYGFAPVVEALEPAARAALLTDVGIKSVILHGAASLVIPFFAVVVAVGWKAARANLIYIYLSVAACVVPYVALGFFSYEFPSLIAGMIGFALSITFASKGLGLAPSERSSEVSVEAEAKPGSETGLVKAFFPLWGTVLILLLTRIPNLGIKPLLTSTVDWVSATLGSLGRLSLSPSLVVSVDEIFATPVSWSYQILYVPALIPFILISLITLAIYKTPRNQTRDAIGRTAKMMVKPSLALLGALVYVRLVMMGEERSSAYIIGTSLAAATGEQWQFLAPFLGAIGSFFSGSATISNLTFGSIQYSVAETLGLSASTVLALQSVGASMGNMVCVNNIVAICSILGISQDEGRILRLNIIPMFLYGLIVITTAFILY
ncbi:MAG: L-lactate permease [Verrucomicrobiota bacterium]